MPNSFMKFYNCEKEKDIIIGNRNPRRDPRLRIIYSKLLKVFHDLLFNSKITDPSCPYIFAKKDVYLDYLILKNTKNIRMISVEHHERLEGNSNYNLKKLLILWSSMVLCADIFPIRLKSFFILFFKIVAKLLVKSKKNSDQFKGLEKTF